jgi:hypothetical protein
MATAATQIQGQILWALAEDIGQFYQVFPLGMDGAGKIGLRLRTELLADDAFM